MSTTVNSVPFESLRANDHVKITRRVKVGLKIWYTSVSGRVIRTERRRNGLHVDRSNDDKAFQDAVLIYRDGTPGEQTTCTMDEFTVIEKLAD